MAGIYGGGDGAARRAGRPSPALTPAVRSGRTRTRTP